MDDDASYRAIATRDARFDGRLFVGVRTTGIYCRPVCPARTPLRRNVTFHPTAAAAQAAGFRPCLRCRPELSPDIAAWHGTANTVRRALALIEDADGATGGARLEGVAARLGVGTRQLRRLFREHLGASPVAVAQTRRVLLARSLIAETRMPMTEIAHAAGFGSVRRFNAVFGALYRRPPGALRRSSEALQSGASGLSVTLPLAEPYDWPAMIGFLRARGIPGVEAVDGQDRYHRTIGIAGAQGWLRVERAGCGLRATIMFPVVTALPVIMARLRRVFDLGADPMAIDGHLGADPDLAPLVAARPGLRVPGAWDGFELAVRAVLGQQITVAAATRLAGRLAETYGTSLNVAGPAGLRTVFPTPDRIACADLRGLGMPASRAASLSSLAAALVAEPRLFDAGRGLKEMVERLRALPGVGEWTAQYIAMRAMHEPDAFPAADIGLMRAMARAGRRPDAAELLARAEAWRPWRAYAAVHLWASESNAALADAA